MLINTDNFHTLLTGIEKNINFAINERNLIKTYRIIKKRYA